MSIGKFIKPTQLKYIGSKHQVDDIHTFSFQPQSELTWPAGQHGMLELRLPNGKTARRMFSLSSAPSEGVVSITTHWLGEQKASDFKKALWNLQPGDAAKVRGPVGPMHVKDSDHQNIFIAIGLGITPFRSIVVEAGLNDHNLRGVLLYSNSDQDSVLFKDELDQAASKITDFDIHYLYAPHQINAQTIGNFYDKTKPATFYLAGSPKIVKSLQKDLQKLGVSASQIKKDPFLGYRSR